MFGDMTYVFVLVRVLRHVDFDIWGELLALSFQMFNYIV